MLMFSAPQLLHAFLGAPRVPECSDNPPDAGCWCCGGRGCPRGQDAARWTTNSMTDQNQCRDPGAEFVCEACVYVRSRTSPVPGRVPGPCSACKGIRVDACTKCEGTGKNSAAGNFRNFSHLFDRDAAIPYINASKGEKPIIRDWLRAPKHGPWFAAIADSGQKQVLPYAPMNSARSRGKIVFDDVVVVLPDAHGWTMLDDMTTLLTAGATKEEITSGGYGAGAWSRCRERIESFEDQWRNHRGGSFFMLCVWLAQRDEEAVQVRIAEEKAIASEKKKAEKKPGKRANSTNAKRTKGTNQDADRGIVTSVPEAISGDGSVSPVALGHAPEQELVCDATIWDDRPMGVPSGKGAKAASARQISFFGDS